MNKTTFCRRLESMIEIQSNTLSAQSKLTGIRNWDSLAILSFIAFADKEFTLPLTGEDILKCETVADLAALLKGRITD